MLQDPSQQPTQQVPVAPSPPATPPVPPEPTFPQTRVDVQEGGVIINVVLAPTTQFTQFIPEELLNQINARRLEMKKEARNRLAMVHDIKRNNTQH